MSLIVSCYVQRERVSEQMNEPYPNTADLDRIYFTYGDPLSSPFVEGWWTTFPQDLQKRVADALESRRLLALENLRSTKGRSLLDEETAMIDEGFGVAKTGGPIALRDWIEYHPTAGEHELFALDWLEIYLESLEVRKQ